MSSVIALVPPEVKGNRHIFSLFLRGEQEPVGDDDIERALDLGAVVEVSGSCVEAHVAHGGLDRL